MIRHSGSLREACDACLPVVGSDVRRQRESDKTGEVPRRNLVFYERFPAMACLKAGKSETGHQFFAVSLGSMSVFGESLAKVLLSRRYL